MKGASCKGLDTESGRCSRAQKAHRVVRYFYLVVLFLFCVCVFVCLCLCLSLCLCLEEAKRMSDHLELKLLVQ